MFCRVRSLAAYGTNRGWCYDEVKNCLLLRKLTTRPARGTQGLAAVARVSRTKLGKPRDGFGLFPAREHQGQHSPRIERPGRAAQPRSQRPLALEGTNSTAEHRRCCLAKSESAAPEVTIQKSWFWKIILWVPQSLVREREDSCSYPHVFRSSTTDFTLPQRRWTTQPGLRLTHPELPSVGFVWYHGTGTLWLTLLNPAVTSEL